MLASLSELEIIPDVETIMSQSNNQYAFALHGGAGAVAGRNYDSVEKHIHVLTKECEALLANGGSALDVVETAVTELERSGMYVAGRGSAPNTAGYVELDASIMHGPSREAGAVAALPGFESPIQIARGVMEKTPHVLLAGRGAEAFARNLGQCTWDGRCGCTRSVWSACCGNIDGWHFWQARRPHWRYTAHRPGNLGRR